MTGGPGIFLIGEEERRAVSEVLGARRLFRYGSEEDQNFLAKVWSLENEVRKYLDIKHAVAVNSGTSALLTALYALGVGPGDEVIVPGYTFIASISSIVFSRAIPILAEIDETLTLDPEDVRKKITPRTKAIMLVHMLGGTGNIEAIAEIAKDHNLMLIEDCAQAFGASYKGRMAGTYGRVGTLSFNCFKTITAGEGGMAVTDDEELYKRIFAIHDQGHLPLRQGVEVGARALLGLDFRMTEVSAAILIEQLKKLAPMKQRLQANKRRFVQEIEDLRELTLRRLPDPQGDIATVLTVFLPNEQLARQVAGKLGTKVVFDSGWHVYNNMENVLNKHVPTPDGCPFTCPHYEGGTVEYKKGMLPQTDALLKRAINISIGVVDAGLGAAFGISIESTDEQVDRAIERFRRVVRDCCK